jgi:ketosteroid isomerase-like protein
MTMQRHPGRMTSTTLILSLCLFTLLACASTTRSIDHEVAALAQRSEQANDALMRGDVVRWRSLLTPAPDFMLMSPFGGTPSHVQPTPERMAQLARFFEGGTLHHELVASYGSPDLIVLAVIEHANVAVGGAPKQDWALRVTLVYRRVGADWQLVHRHADPLGHSITLEQAAALGRGASAPPG